MKKLMAIAGWTLRACALICMTWIFGQVLGGKITTLGVVLSSVVWHAAFALTGVALVGASRGSETASDEGEAGSTAAA